MFVKLSNRMAEVRLCGFAETVSVVAPTPKTKSGRTRKAAVDKRDGVQADRISAIWRGLFEDADAVRISPICPKMVASS